MDCGKIWEYTPCFHNGTCESQEEYRSSNGTDGHHLLIAPLFSIFVAKYFKTQPTHNRMGLYTEMKLKGPIIEAVQEHNMPNLRYKTPIHMNLSRMAIHQNGPSILTPQLTMYLYLLCLRSSSKTLPTCFFFFSAAMMGTPGVNGRVGLVQQEIYGFIWK